MRIEPIYCIKVTGDLWPDFTSMKVALKPPWGWDGCMCLIELVLRQRMDQGPLQEGLLFLGSFISSLCLLLVLSIALKIYHSYWRNNLWTIKLRKLKFVARLVIRWEFDYDLPLCMIFKFGQFNLNPTWDTAEIVSLKIILDILEVERCLPKRMFPFVQIRMGAIIHN